MSWFNASQLSSFAKQALSQAQKSIDRVLDIQEEEPAAWAQTIPYGEPGTAGLAGRAGPRGPFPRQRPAVLPAAAWGAGLRPRAPRPELGLREKGGRPGPRAGAPPQGGSRGQCFPRETEAQPGAGRGGRVRGATCVCPGAAHPRRVSGCAWLCVSETSAFCGGKGERAWP